jgi:large subunit ribosomal protein L15e
MGAYRYLQELWKKKQCETMQFILRIRTWEYRQLPTMHRVTRPSRPDKARRLGYKAKQGVVIYRCAVRRGSRKTMVAKGIVYGKPKSQGVNQMKATRNLRALAEERCGRKMQDLRVLNSYWVGQDGTYKYYEIIMVDPHHNAIRNDARMNWICRGHQKHRELHGLTSAGRSSRGLRVRGNKDNKKRPSRRANYLRRNRVNLHRYR